MFNAPGRCPKREFVFGPNVEDRDRAGAQSLREFFARNRLQAVAIVEIAAHDPLDLRHVSLGDPAQSGQQIENPVIGKPVIDEFAVAPCAHHEPARRMC